MTPHSRGFFGQKIAYDKPRIGPQPRIVRGCKSGLKSALKSSSVRPALSRAYTVWFSSDFEPNSDSCDSFLSRAEFQLCRASFAVQCLCSVQGETRSDKPLPTGNRTVRWISDMSEILVAPREGIAQLKQSYEPTALNSVLFPSLRLRGNRSLTI